MDVLTYYLDDTSPVLKRQLSTQDDGALVDLVGGVTFRLQVRALWESSLAIDVPMVVDVDADELTYQPTLSDFDGEGVYRAWIRIDYGAGVVQTTDEFQINVFAHGPGQGASVGAVYRAARALEPISWDSLRNYTDYGDPELQRVIELAKLRVLGVSIPVADEASLDPRVVDFIAKKALCENVLYAAISFWSDQTIQQTARGNTEEVATYPDRIRTAQEAIDRFRADLERQASELGPILGPTTTYDAPAVDTAGSLLTPGLDEYPAQPAVSQGYYRQPR